MLALVNVRNPRVILLIVCLIKVLAGLLSDGCPVMAT